MKMRIGVLMGGTSSEREVSLRSGAAVFRALKSRGYDAVEVDAGPDLCEILGRERIDMAFLALHGGHGENGSVQGLLETLGIPYTGSGVLASALAMDKEASKKVFIYEEIPVPPFAILRQGNSAGKRSADAGHNIIKPETGFPMPWVIKPSAEGSSVGVSIVKNADDLQNALDTAFSYGPGVIIEKYIEGPEVHIGILNDGILGGVEVRPSLGFYSYEAKYTAGLTEYILPPQLDEKTYERAKKTALAAHTALCCGGATRVDLRIDTSGNPYVLEVNTIPGMTETSLLPKIARQAGLDFPELIEEILKGVIQKAR
jgi:D-alanine-D-alanine ligase